MTSTAPIVPLSLVGTTVKLTYFKLTGKYYAEGEYVAQQRHVFEVVDEVREMRRRGELPGLCRGACEFIIHISVDENSGGYPTLVLPLGTLR
jgi:hypothetical protein